MGSFFKFGQAVPEIFELYCSKNRGLFRQDLRELTYIKGTKKKIFDGFFCNFLGISTYKFVKNDPKFENKSLFDAKFYGA